MPYRQAAAVEPDPIPVEPELPDVEPGPVVARVDADSFARSEHRIGRIIALVIAFVVISVALLLRP